MDPTVAIIILNWNRWIDTIECLESIYNIDYEDYIVILVDNGSKDNSVEMIKKYCAGELNVNSKFLEYKKSNKPIAVFEYIQGESESGEKGWNTFLCSQPKLILLENKDNLGFAEGNNIGIKFVLDNINSKYILFLNNDTIVEKRFLRELVKIAESDMLIGIVGPKTYYYDYYGRSDIINFIGADINPRNFKEYREGNGEIDKGQFDRGREVGKIEGSCMLVSENVIKRIGMFDPEYFTYWEDLDFCTRARVKGFKLIYAYKSEIWHKEAASSGGTSSPNYIYYMSRNQILFSKKNNSNTDFMLSLLFLILIKAPSNIGYHVIYKKNIKNLNAYLRGLTDGIKYAFNNINIY